MGVNVYGWRSSGVNHVLIFELDPRNHLSEQHLMELSAVFGVVWTLSLLCFYYSESLSIPQYINPLALAVIMIVFWINPFRCFRHYSRYWSLKVCVSIPQNLQPLTDTYRLFYFFLGSISWCPIFSG